MQGKGYSWDDIKNILKKSDMAEAKLIKSINPGKALSTYWWIMKK